MYAVFISALMFLMKWVFTKAVIAFVVLTVLFVLVENFSGELFSLIGDSLSGSSLSGAFSNMASGVWYFLNFFQISIGVPMLISAFITRFLIRRLPVIG